MRKGFLTIGIFLLILGITITTFSLLPIPLTTTKTFQVEKSSTEINESFIVPPREHQYYSKDFRTGASYESKLLISFSVTSGGNLDINFWVTVDTEFLKWRAGETSNSYIYRDKASSFNETWTLPTLSPLYFVFDNSFSTTASKTISLKVSRIWFESEQREVLEDRTLLPLVSSYVGIAIVFVGIAAAGASIISKSKKAESKS